MLDAFSTFHNILIIHVPLLRPRNLLYFAAKTVKFKEKQYLLRCAYGIIDLVCSVLHGKPNFIAFIECSQLFLRGVFLNKVFREEKKFLLSVDEFRRISHQLGQVMSEDPHNDVNGYIIRSLYFDTVYDNDFFEKRSGIETRRKIRLRCYDPKADFAMLEMKQKQGAYQLKRSLRVAKKDAIRLTRGDYSPLLTYPESFAAECYALMKCRCYIPKTIVEYNRKAYIAKENKIRVTFDNNIVSTESSFDLFSENLNMNPVLDKYLAVMEVKFNGFLLDYIRRMINCANRSELSVSKYMLARQNGYQTRL